MNHKRDPSSPNINDLKDKVFAAKTVEMMSLKDVLASASEYSDMPMALSASHLKKNPGSTPVFNSGASSGSSKKKTNLYFESGSGSKVKRGINKAQSRR